MSCFCRRRRNCTRIPFWPVVRWKQGRDLVESKQIDRSELEGLGREGEMKNSGLVMILKLAEDGGLERGCHRFLSACVKEVLQGSGEASLYFRGKQEPLTIDLWFLAFPCTSGWMVKGRGSFTTMNRLILHRPVAIYRGRGQAPAFCAYSVFSCLHVNTHSVFFLPEPLLVCASHSTDNHGVPLTHMWLRLCSMYWIRVHS